MVWENTSVVRRDAWQRRFISVVCLIAVVAAGALLQYLLAIAAEKERSARLSFQLETATEQRSLTSLAFNYGRLRAISVSSGFFVVSAQHGMYHMLQKINVILCCIMKPLSCVLRLEIKGNYISGTFF